MTKTSSATPPRVFKDLYKVLICGGRDFLRRPSLFADESEADEIFRWQEQYAEWRLGHMMAKREPDLIIHGGAKGADSGAAEILQKKYEVNILRVPAKWNKHGKSAGPIRNTEMLLTYTPNLVIGFPGGTGTKHMLKISRKQGIETIDLTEDYDIWVATQQRPNLP